METPFLLRAVNHPKLNGVDDQRFLFNHVMPAIEVAKRQNWSSILSCRTNLRRTFRNFEQAKSRQAYLNEAKLIRKRIKLNDKRASWRQRNTFITMPAGVFIKTRVRNETQLSRIAHSCRLSWDRWPM
jgi:hypothetical protein